MSGYGSLNKQQKLLKKILIDKDYTLGYGNFTM